MKYLVIAFMFVGAASWACGGKDKTADSKGDTYTSEVASADTKTSKPKQ